MIRFSRDESSRSDLGIREGVDLPTANILARWVIGNPKVRRPIGRLLVNRCSDRLIERLRGKGGVCASGRLKLGCGGELGGRCELRSGLKLGCCHLRNLRGCHLRRRDLGCLNLRGLQLGGSLERCGLRIDQLRKRIIARGRGLGARRSRRSRDGWIGDGDGRCNG